MAAKPYYITTAIAYPNGPPHIGHAYEAIATDAIARFMRLDGYDVFFLTGTDEHGIKMLQTAAKEKHDAARAGRAQRAALPGDGEVAQLLERRLHPHHRAASLPVVGRDLGAHAGRRATSISTNIPAGTRCATRPITTKARPARRKGQRLGPHGTPVEWVEEESYFFRLSAYQDKLIDLYASHPDFVLPRERLNEVLSFVRGGLQDLSISRTTFDWGIPVPGDPKHVMYVWVDALTNYITGVGYPDTTAKCSAATGRPICTSSARTSCASMPCIGRPS